MISTPYLVLVVILISVGVTSAYAVTITLDGNVDIVDILNMNFNKITNLGTPTEDTDAATKAYVDSVGALPSQYTNEALSIIQPGNGGGTIASCDLGDTRIGGGVSTLNGMEITDSFPSMAEEVEVWEGHAFNSGLTPESLIVVILCFDDALPPHVP